MATSDLTPGWMGRDQGDGDTEFFLRANEMFGIVELECKTEQSRDRAKRNVSLVPVEPQPQHLVALEVSPADHTVVDHRRRVGTCFRAGQAKTGNLAAIGKPRQPSLLLIAGPEPHQEFAGPSEFGTITVTAAVSDRDESFRTTSEWA